MTVCNFVSPWEETLNGTLELRYFQEMRFYIYSKDDFKVLQFFKKVAEVLGLNLRHDINFNSWDSYKSTITVKIFKGLFTRNKIIRILKRNFSISKVNHNTFEIKDR